MKLFGVDFEPTHESQEAMAVRDPINEQAQGMAMVRKSRKKRKSIVLFGQELVPERRRSAVKKTRSSSPPLPPTPLPPLVIKTIDNMEGKDPIIFVTRKILECSDVDANQNRLFVPKSDALLRMLREEEKREVEGGGGLPVTAVDPRGGTHSLRLKRWASLNKIVLNGGWRKLAEENSLEAVKDCIELWSFRAEDAKLCFALNVNRQVQ